MQLLKRPRRNRKTAAIRAMVQETRLHPSDFVAPLFVIEGENYKEGISSMPGVFRLSLDLLLREAEMLCEMGVRGIDLFPVLAEEEKDSQGSAAWREEGLCCRTIKALKREFPDLCVMVDLALDPYTDHGHDGVVDREGNILNDESVALLGKAALVQAQAGADVIAPSDMMDGRIGYLRELLDSHDFTDVSLLSYSSKYASAFYGPFRDALHSAPKFGDKKTYQMNPANARESMIECLLDEEEGADILMVKPALAYLDIIARVRECTALPIAAYHVSGEYSMLMAAGEKGWLDVDKVLYESLMGIKRAGADMIFTYATSRIVPQLERLT